MATAATGLSAREAERRLVSYGPNELRRRGGLQWPRRLARRLIHPLALLLWVATALALASGSAALSVAIVAVVVLNALFAFVQERQAERAVEALQRYLPQRVSAVRDGTRLEIDSHALAPGDLLLIGEGAASLRTHACWTARSTSTCRH